MGWFLGGFLVMIFLQRFLRFHHHDVAEEGPAAPRGHRPALGEPSARSLGWVGVALGLSLHSVIDGLAMAAALVSGAHGHGDALGLGTALAVILHKPFGALAIATLMTAGGAVRRARHWVNLAFALVTRWPQCRFILVRALGRTRTQLGLAARWLFLPVRSSASQVWTCCPNCSSTRTTG